MSDRKRNDIIRANRPRTVTLTGFFLLMEWFGFLALGILHLITRLYRYDLSPEAVWLVWRLDIDIAHARILSVIFLLLALASLIAGVGFFRTWYLAWLTATATQGVALLTAISLYFSSEPAFAYIIMAYCTIIVSYLNYPEVQEAFRSREADFCRKVAR